MIKNTIFLIFIIAIILSFAGSASAFGILVRAPGSAGGALKFKYTDYTVADYRGGIQKMIIGARPGSIYGVEGYGILSATADAPQYTFDAIETSEVFYYIMPLGCSADKVKASMIDPAYGIAELIIFFNNTRRRSNAIDKITVEAARFGFFLLFDHAMSLSNSERP